MSRTGATTAPRATPLLPALALLSLALLAPASARAAEPPVDFNRDVRPILSESCFQCHGPDTAKRKGKLRLDTHDGAFSPAESGAPAFVPGKAAESEALTRIASDDPLERMPPPDSGRALSPAQVATLRRWVEQGAEWKGHWSYIPPVRPAVPAVTEGEAPAGFVRGDADRFVLAKLKARGLKPSPRPTAPP